MKIKDFIKQEPTPKKSGYKVVVGDTPKEQQLEKQASQAAVLETNLTTANLKVDELQKENEFLKDQVKRTQHEIDDARGKVETQQNLQLELVEKENHMILIQEETHELTIKEQRNSEKIKQLEIDLNSKTNEYDQLARQNDKITLEFQSVSANYNGLRAEFDKQKDFSEKLQNDYNKIGERNTGLLSEREELSKLKSEFEAKSVRLGDELQKAQEKIRNLDGKLVEVTNLNDVREDEAIKSNSLSVKLRKDLDAAVKVSDSLKSKLHESREDMEDLSQITQLYKDQLSREKRETAEWNIAKQQLKLGNAKTVPNKLGFGASPFFKLAEVN